MCVVRELEHYGCRGMTIGGALLPLTPLNDKGMVVNPDFLVQVSG